MRKLLFGQEWHYCDALIDQGHYPGTKIKCSNHDDIKEVVINGIKRDLCDRCIEILKTEPNRLSFKD
jgi:hypothetical protein